MKDKTEPKACSEEIFFGSEITLSTCKQLLKQIQKKLKQKSKKFAQEYVVYF